MYSILGQVSYPVFLYCVFFFFIFASVFSFIVGVGFATRNPTMLRIFVFMNKGYCVRRVVKPLTMPHLVEPALNRHFGQLGLGILMGATTSILLLMDVDSAVFQPIFLGPFSYFSATILASYTKSFLLIGNGVCVLVGLLMLFFPHQLSSIETFTDRWYTLRKQTRPFTQEHLVVDQWFMAHPTVSGVALSIMSLGLFVSMYGRI